MMFQTPSLTDSAYAPLLHDELDTRDDVTLTEHDAQYKGMCVNDIVGVEMQLS